MDATAQVKSGSTGRLLSGARPLVPSDGFDDRFGAWRYNRILRLALLGLDLGRFRIIRRRSFLGRAQVD